MTTDEQTGEKPREVKLDDPEVVARRRGAKPESAPKKLAPRARRAPIKPAVAPVAVKQEPVVTAPVSAPAKRAEPSIDSESNAELRNFLRGKTVTEAVRSADGAFATSAGTVIDDALLDEAAAHDAILMLAVSVDA